MRALRLSCHSAAQQRLRGGRPAARPLLARASTPQCASSAIAALPLDDAAAHVLTVPVYIEYTDCFQARSGSVRQQQRRARAASALSVSRIRDARLCCV